MKKLVAALLAVVMCLSVSACGGSGKANHTIKYNDGTTEEFSTKELLKIKDTDGRTWEKIKNGTISGTGKITAIETGYAGFENVTLESVANGKVFKFNYVQLTLNDNIKVLVRQETCGDYYVGDTVRFSGTVVKGVHSIYLYVKCADTKKEDTQQFVFRVE